MLRVFSGLGLRTPSNGSKHTFRLDQAKCFYRLALCWSGSFDRFVICRNADPVDKDGLPTLPQDEGAGICHGGDEGTPAELTCKARSWQKKSPET